MKYLLLPARALSVSIALPFPLAAEVARLLVTERDSIVTAPISHDLTRRRARHGSVQAGPTLPKTIGGIASFRNDGLYTRSQAAWKC